MKRLNLLLATILMSFIMFSCSEDSTSPSAEEYEKIPDPTGTYKFDIKTKFANKLNDAGFGFLLDGIPFGDTALKVLNKFMTSDEPNIDKKLKAESVVVGGLCYGQLKLWINEIEAGN